MIGSTLIERKQLRCFYFHPSKKDCFELKGPCQHQGNIIKQKSLINVINEPTVRCQRVTGKRLSIQNNRVSMDENMKIEKVAFIQTNRSFDFISPIKLATSRVFIFSKIKHKIKFVEVYTPVESSGSDS